MKTYQYDATGNITYKSDFGTYTYGENGAGPHAVTSTSGIAGNWTFTYDAVAAAIAWYAPYLVGPLVSGIVGAGVTATAITGGLVAAASGAAFGGISTGTASGALWGATSAVSAFVAGPVGAGIYSQLRGGNFVTGFLSSGLGAAMGGATGQITQNLTGFSAELIRFTAAAVVGGTTSVIGGGKFADGALSGAFGYLTAAGLARAAQNEGDSIVTSEESTSPAGTKYVTDSPEDQALYDTLMKNPSFQYKLDVKDAGASELSLLAYCPSVQGIGRLIAKKTASAGSRHVDFSVPNHYCDEPAYQEVTAEFTGFMYFRQDGVDFVPCDKSLNLSKNVKTEAEMIAVKMSDEDLKKLKIDNRYFVRTQGTLKGPRDGTGFIWVAYYLLEVARLDEVTPANSHQDCDAFGAAR